MNETCIPQGVTLIVNGRVFLLISSARSMAERQS